MNSPESTQRAGCARCANAPELDFDIRMAYQPIIDVEARRIFAHEALVRGPNNESAAAVFERVNEANQYRFDQNCRVAAIEGATELGMDTCLAINFLPNAVYQAATCIQVTMRAAESFGFPLERILFEVSERELVIDRAHLRSILDYYRKRGFLTAIDDFGAGHSGLNLLADFVPDYVKLDMQLVQGIDANATRRAIVRGLVVMTAELGVRLIAEGVETRAEFETLRELGIELFQGFYFARPAFRALARVDPTLYE